MIAAIEATAIRALVGNRANGIRISVVATAPLTSDTRRASIRRWRLTSAVTGPPLIAESPSRLAGVHRGAAGRSSANDRCFVIYFQLRGVPGFNDENS
jgi:hypothetical protein